MAARLHELTGVSEVSAEVQHRHQTARHRFRGVHPHLRLFCMTHAPQQVVTEAVDCYSLLIHEVGSTV